MNKSGTNSKPSFNCDDLQELIPAYIAGALIKSDIEYTQQLVNKCLGVSVSLKTYVAISDAYANNVPPAEPPAELHDRLMSRLRARREQLSDK
jgi:hypothetical protein